MSDCKKCEFYDEYNENCGAFECNGLECPELPCEKYYIFTFGCGMQHAGKYVKIKGTYGQARAKMFEKYGEDWSFQYSEDEWENMKKDPKRNYLMETELEVLE
jgi:hypothetical protein